MLKVTNIKVKSLELDHLNVSWEIDDTNEDPLDYTFTIERSESPMGPFDQVTEPFSDRYFFRDSIVNLYSRWRQLWYRVKVTQKSSSEFEYSEPATQGARPPLDALEVRRLELIAFREHIGRLVWVFPVRTFGQRCPDCYDKRSGNRRRSNCPTCFSTTYVRGYLDPIATYIQIDPSPKHQELLQIAKTEQSNTTARTPYFPPLKPKDIIVEAENRRWRIERVSSTQRLRATLHHELVLHEIPRADIEYTIPINIEDLMSHEPSPQREFTNPHNLESLSDAEWINNLLMGHGFGQ